MKPSNIIWIVITVALLTGLVFLIVNKETEAGKKDGYNWERNYQIQESQPYDLSLFYQTVKNTWGPLYHEIPEKSTLEKYFPDLESSGRGIYFFVGKSIYLTDNEMDNLESFVNNGGTVFISSNGIPADLFKRFSELRSCNMERYYADSMQVYFRNKFLSKRNFNFVNIVKNKADKNIWCAFNCQQNEDMSFGIPSNSTVNIASGLVKISDVDTLVEELNDFICVYHGDGRILLHANPVFFSNYYLKHADGVQYLTQVFRHLPKEEMWYDLSGGMNKINAKTGETALPLFAFINSNPALKYAWWFIVFGIVLFLLVGGRRMQRPIPVLKKPENNTLSFIDSIGHFYFKERSNAKVYKREWNQFLDFVRLHIRIAISETDEATVLAVAERSGVSAATIARIFETHKSLHTFTELTEEEIKRASQEIHTFYLEYKNKYGK